MIKKIIKTKHHAYMGVFHTNKFDNILYYALGENEPYEVKDLSSEEIKIDGVIYASTVINNTEIKNILSLSKNNNLKNFNDFLNYLLEDKIIIYYNLEGYLKEKYGYDKIFNHKEAMDLIMEDENRTYMLENNNILCIL